MSRDRAVCIVDKDFIPFFTSFGPPTWHKSYLSFSKPLFPYGEYHYTYRHQDKIKFAKARVFPHGYSSDGVKTLLENENDLEFEHWL